MTVTKRDLVLRALREAETAGDRKLNQLDVQFVVQSVLDNIGRAMAKGDKVELRNFGVFEIKVRKSRVGRNPHRPEVDVPIPERAIVKFKAGKELRAVVGKLPTAAGKLAET